MLMPVPGFFWDISQYSWCKGEMVIKKKRGLDMERICEKSNLVVEDCWCNTCWCDRQEAKAKVNSVCEKCGDWTDDCLCEKD